MSQRLLRTATCGHLLALAVCSLFLSPVSCGWFGLSQDEMLAKLRADGGHLSIEKVYDILRAAKDPSWLVDSYSVKELRSLNEFTLDKCTAEELDGRRSIADLPLQDKAYDIVRRYAHGQYNQFVIYCASNADKLFRRAIIAIGARTRQELSYFRVGVHTNEGTGLERAKAMEEYLTRGRYVDDQYKRTIATGCKSVNKRLRHIVVIQDHAKRVEQPINFNHSLQEWLLLNEYCELYDKKFANK